MFHRSATLDGGPGYTLFDTLVVACEMTIIGKIVSLE